MRILHITNSLRGGGVQNFLLSLLPEQVKLGHEVTLVVIEQFDYDYCYKLASILKSYHVDVVCLGKKRKNKRSMLKKLMAFRLLVERVKPDVINTHAELSHMYGAVAVMGKKSSHVITIHNSPEFWSKYCKMICKNKPLIFCSEAAFKLRRQESTMMTTIENGISPSIVKTDKRVDLRDELGLKQTDKIIVLVGSLRPQKNYEFLKSIVDEAKDPSLHFCICGGNYGKGYIPASVFEGYERNIHLLGLRSDVSAIENCADLFLSCSNFEGLPIAVLEAYCNGIPCVLSPILPHKNIADVEKVWIPKSFEPKAFLESIYEALTCSDSHDDIAELRQKQIEKYLISNTCKQYIAFYEKVLAS